MTFQTEIAEALAKPVDQEIFKRTVDIYFEDNSPGAHQNAIYTLLCRIRDLEAQVEQERWRDAEK